LVALAEEGLHEGPIANDIATHYLRPMFSPSDVGASVPDTLVLGCTHFPMLAGAIRRAVGAKVEIVDSAATTAASVDAQLREAGLTRTEGGDGLVRLLATDGRERFARVGSRFLERAITPDEVELVDL
jgi:glutamate racemase